MNKISAKIVINALIIFVAVLFLQIFIFKDHVNNMVVQLLILFVVVLLITVAYRIRFKK